MLAGSAESSAPGKVETRPLFGRDAQNELPALRYYCRFCASFPWRTAGRGQLSKSVVCLAANFALRTLPIGIPSSSIANGSQDLTDLPNHGLGWTLNRDALMRRFLLQMKEMCAAYSVAYGKFTCLSSAASRYFPQFIG
jgi:hypothetical protein